MWVTGSSGSGKSSVCEVLKGRGYRAVDADWEGYSHWVDRITDEAVFDPPYPVPPGWLEQFAWKLSVERVERLAATASSGVTFLCGSVETSWMVGRTSISWCVWSSMTRHCAVVSQRGRRTSLESIPANLRPPSPRNQDAEAQYRKFGVTTVDATRPLDAVVRDVLAVAGLATGS